MLSLGGPADFDSSNLCLLANSQPGCLKNWHVQRNPVTVSVFAQYKEDIRQLTGNDLYSE